MRKHKESREQFLLQGSVLCYSPMPAMNSSVSVRDILKYFGDDPKYFDHIEGVYYDKPNVYSSIQTLYALFKVYSLKVVYSDDLTPAMAQTMRTIFNRIYLSTGGKIVVDDQAAGKTKPNDDLFELKMSDLEMCTLNEKGDVDCSFEDDLLHELFVSFYYTNRLRKIIPNFQLCYAGIKASKSYAEICELDDVNCACNTSQTVDYLVLERLDGLTMSESLKSCTINDFLSWIMQITLSLEMGHIHFGFTHYNLNTDNVVIVPFKNDSGNTDEVKVKYWHRNQILIMNLKSAAVMKSFETAHVGHRGDTTEENFGVVGYESLGIFHDESRPFYDIYKILMWSLYYLRKHNNAVFDQASKLSKFFGVSYARDLNKILDTEADLGFAYSVEISKTERMRSLGEFTSLIFLEFPKMEFVTRADAFGEIDTLKCVDYCPVGGYHSEPNRSLENPLEFLGARGCLERFWGLNLRVTELKKLTRVVCQDSVANDERDLCSPTSDELASAQSELEEFTDLINLYKMKVYGDALIGLSESRNEINELIRVLNMDLESYNTMSKSEESSYIVGSAMDRLRRDRDFIKGKAVALVRDLSFLNRFAEEFDAGDRILNISIDPMLSFD